MLFDHWYYHLRIIPESIALVALGTALVKVKFSLNRIMLAGLLIGLIGFITLLIPMGYYGVQMILGILVFLIALRLILKMSLLKSATAALLSFIILTFLEFITLLVQTRIYGYTEENLRTLGDSTKFLLSLPPLLVVIIMACVSQIYIHKKNNKINRAKTS